MVLYRSSSLSLVAVFLRKNSIPSLIQLNQSNIKIVMGNYLLRDFHLAIEILRIKGCLKKTEQGEGEVQREPPGVFHMNNAT